MLTITADLDRKLERLAIYRLAEDLTFDALARRMEAADCYVPPRVLHLALTQRLRTRPRDRTIYRIDRFVALIDRKTPRKRRRSAA